MTFTNNKPNTTLVLPGTCQASCKFCFWNKNQQQNQAKFIHGLLQLLPTIYKYKTLSISGGEPSLSPVLGMLEVLIDKSQLEKVVITTNGANLSNILNVVASGFINHVNISRHHVNDSKNEVIFGTKALPTIQEIKEFSYESSRLGVDVTYNCVLGEHVVQDLYEFIELAKATGISSVCFRRPFDQVEPHVIETYLKEEFTKIRETNCPVCSSIEYLVRGLKIMVRTSVGEPSKKLGSTYEYILQPDGLITSDWKGENIINTTPKKIDKFNKTTPVEYYGCGASISGKSGC